jgi:hypothetical protein
MYYVDVVLEVIPTEEQKNGEDQKTERKKGPTQHDKRRRARNKGKIQATKRRRRMKECTHDPLTKKRRKDGTRKV